MKRTHTGARARQTHLHVGEVDAVQVGQHLVDLRHVVQHGSRRLSEVVQRRVATQRLRKSRHGRQLRDKHGQQYKLCNGRKSKKHRSGNFKQLQDFKPAVTQAHPAYCHCKANNRFSRSRYFLIFSWRKREKNTTRFSFVCRNWLWKPMLYQSGSYSVKPCTSYFSKAVGFNGVA